MDYSKSLELDQNDKRTHRVRSWYMYEQYKSLESNQITAAQKLKDRSYQHRILQQELFERRARRNLYPKTVSCHEEIMNDSGSKAAKGDSRYMSASSEDFLECFCEDDTSPPVSNQDASDLSQNDSQAYLPCSEDLSLEVKEECNYSDSITSVVENSAADDDIKEQLKLVKNDIAENLNLQLETVKESLECVNKYTKMCEHSPSTEYDDDESVCSTENYTLTVSMNNKNSSEYDRNLLTMWSKLVSFAYQLIQLNHGNCYDYSSHFLTAVLACDVLRLGVGRMCDILQHYVSPIKFTDSFDTSTESKNTNKYVKTRLCVAKKPFGNKFIPRHQIKNRRKNCRYARTCATEMPNANFSCEYDGFNTGNLYSFENRVIGNKCHIFSEPIRSISTVSSETQPSMESSRAKWSHKLPQRKNNHCCRERVANPMIKFNRYFDDLLKDIENVHL